MEPSEKVAIGEELWPKEKEAAKERQKLSLGRGKKVRQITGPFKKGETRERVAKVVGWSGQTYGRAKDVVEVSECESLFMLCPLRPPHLFYTCLSGGFPGMVKIG